MTTHRCECPEKSTNAAGLMGFHYEPEEVKAIEHQPNECPGDYGVRQWSRGGKIMWLCSCCCYLGDELVATPERHSSVPEDYMTDGPWRVASS